MPTIRPWILAPAAFAVSVLAADSDETASGNVSDGASPAQVEEVIVTAPRPAPGKVLPLEYMEQTYVARDKGSCLYRRGDYEEAFPYLLAAAKRGFPQPRCRLNRVTDMLDVLIGWPDMVLLFAVGLGVAVFLARDDPVPSPTFVTSIYYLDVDQGTYFGNRLYRNWGSAAFEDVMDVAGVADGGWGLGCPTSTLPPFDLHLPYIPI
ncbi:MAG: hypothetical protein OXL38_11245 [Gammaproteobacteria bacterium]|nr:hypothetical protein [Gammaproteobacteria bacterium]